LAINIGIKKLWEDAIWVYYEFDTPVAEEISESHSKAIRAWEAYGYCKFNKLTAQFILDEEKTDPYLLKKRYFANLVHMVLCRTFLSGGSYPDKTGYAAWINS
jgi:hypothetical protein